MRRLAQDAAPDSRLRGVCRRFGGVHEHGFFVHAIDGNPNVPGRWLCRLGFLQHRLGLSQATTGFLGVAQAVVRHCKESEIEEFGKLLCSLLLRSVFKPPN